MTLERIAWKQNLWKPDGWKTFLNVARVQRNAAGVDVEKAFEEITALRQPEVPETEVDESFRIDEDE